MDTLTTVDEVRARARAWRARGERIGLVPTMGNLHAGHLSLMAALRPRVDRIIASIFVNPLQFGPGEDFTRYPRTPDEDLRLLGQGHCDLLFHPDVAQIYPQGGTQPTLISVRGLSQILCGESRPGHFDGVATVVAKLFNIVAPDVAIFGEKDYQQFLIIRRMTLDLALPVEVLGAPTVRAADGLALSSRNRYLSDDERARAPAIYQALSQAAARIGAGDADVSGGITAIEHQGHALLQQAGMAVDYFSIRNARDLLPPDPAADEWVVLTAARLGRARLIDNLRVPRR